MAEKKLKMDVKVKVDTNSDVEDGVETQLDVLGPNWFVTFGTKKDPETGEEKTFRRGIVNLNFVRAVDFCPKDVRGDMVRVEFSDGSTSDMSREDWRRMLRQLMEMATKNYTTK